MKQLNNCWSWYNGTIRQLRAAKELNYLSKRLQICHNMPTPVLKQPITSHPAIFIDSWVHNQFDQIRQKAALKELTFRYDLEDSLVHKSLEETQSICSAKALRILQELNIDTSAELGSLAPETYRRNLISGFQNLQEYENSYISHILVLDEDLKIPQEWSMVR